MKRRHFCKLMGTAAAVLPIGAEDRAPDSFNKLSENYAEFCAKRPDERTFYILENGKIVSQKLDERTWRPTEWGKPPELPVAGGSWDGVPMTSPIAGLSGQGRYQPTWESLLEYEAPEWYQDAKFGIWAHWSPQCVPEAGDWYARNMYLQGSKQY
ncbi:MAG: alpha-L-fucosidase, partial [Acidobacteriaceae bacterium]|nr:alpha-L-fucosidase [Acidobacteriaceae bacterium]